MSRKPKDPQTHEQMTFEMMERKANRSPESRLYSRSESLQAVDSAVSGIVSHLATEFRESRRAEGKIRLSDPVQIGERIQLYLNTCAEAAVLPTMAGFARSVGYSSEGLCKWRRNHPDSESAELLERLKDICASALEAGGLKGVSNAVISIFLLKSNHGYRDAITLETAQVDNQPLPAPQDPEEIAERWRLLEDE